MTAGAVRGVGRGDSALIAGAGVLAALVIGVAMARNPLYGVVLVAAALYVPLVLIDPPLGIAVWVALSYLSSLGKVGLALSGGTMLLALAALGTLRRGAEPRLAGRGLLLAPFFLLLAWFAVSLVWSEDPSLGADMLVEWVQTGVILLAVAVTVRTARDVRLILASLVIGPVLSVIVGVANDGLTGAPATVDTATSVGGRLIGGEGDPNFLALAIVPAIVLVAVLCGRRPAARWAAVVATGVLVVGLVATQSRGGLVAAAAACVAAMAFMAGQRWKVILLAASVVAVGGIYLAVNEAPLDRILGAKDQGGTGRTELWGVAWNVANDHPLVGVGLNNFTVYAPRYADRPGLLRYADLIAEKPHVVHNTYLEIAVESGIVGFLLLAGAVAACLRAVATAVRMFDRRGDRELAQLARAVLVASIAVLTGAFFLSMRYRVGLWVLLAMCVALLAIARTGARSPAAARAR